MKSRGFTIIETVVYLALFALMIGGILVATYSLFESSDRNQTKAMMQEEENYLVGKINFALSGTRSISSPIANASGNSLTVVASDGSSKTFTLSGVNLQQDGTTLNNSNVTITKLVFIHTYTGGTNPVSIEAGFTISAKTPNGLTVSEIATTTRYIRK